MAKSTSVRRLVTVAALSSAFTLPAIGAAHAVTVSVPGTGATQPCTASADVTGNSDKVPPVTVTFATSCRVG